jgi:hypothetical protein
MISALVLLKLISHIVSSIPRQFQNLQNLLSLRSKRNCGNSFAIPETTQSIFYSPFTIHHSPFIIHHSSFIIHHSSFTIHHSPFIIHHSPFTIHHSPFTIHHSSFTIHHSPSIIFSLCLLCPSNNASNVKI